jgi:hypothetical protein
MIWTAEAKRFTPPRALFVVQPQLGFLFGSVVMVTVNYTEAIAGPLVGELTSFGLTATLMF